MISLKGQITPTEQGLLDDSTRVINLCHMGTTVGDRLCEDLAYSVENQTKVTGRTKSSLVKEALGRLRQNESVPIGAGLRLVIGKIGDERGRSRLRQKVARQTGEPRSGERGYVDPQRVPFP